MKMNGLFNLKPDELEKLFIKDYFKSIELAIDSELSVDALTRFFTNQNYDETQPYLTRRRLIPNDTRFKQIELVYDDSKQIATIVWDITISLSQLKEIFGEPIIHNEPYNNSTCFSFRSNNREIEIIQTRHPKWLSIVKGNNGFEYPDKNNQIVELIDPVFSFIQFNFQNLK